MNTSWRLHGFVLIFLLCCGATSAQAANWFVRVDGGNDSECTGKRNAPYPGIGTGQPCAFSHPFFVLPPVGSVLMRGGDSLTIGPGSYRMGVGAPNTASCSSSVDCTMASPPKGTLNNPTRITGETDASGQCSTAPELYGVLGARAIVTLQNTNYVELSCLELTDHSRCIQSGPTRRCPQSGAWARAGVRMSDSTSITLSDLNIHGLANTGIRAGRLRNAHLKNVTISGNAWSGLDWDLSPDSSRNAGSFFFDRVDIGYNGCAEGYPDITDRVCWAQSAGGYGDGFGSALTGGSFVIRDSVVHHNTSDGFDLLYGDNTASIRVHRSRFIANAGNQLKLAGRLITITDTEIVGQCGYFEGQPRMQANTDHCRARGNALSLSLYRGSKVTVNNTTITGEGDCLVVTGCRDGSCNNEGSVTFSNSIFVGQVDRYQPSQQACLHYAVDGNVPEPTWQRSIIHRVKNATCPAGDNLCVDPEVVDARIDRFDGHLTPESPAIDRANARSVSAFDVERNRRPNGPKPDIGAFEYQTPGLEDVVYLELDRFYNQGYGWRFERVYNRRDGWRFRFNSNREEARFAFTGADQDIALQVYGYDIDSAQEVSVLLNDQVVGTLNPTKNRQRGRSQFIRLPREQQQAGNNQLTLRQRSPGGTWGTIPARLHSLSGDVLTLSPNQKITERFGYGTGTPDNRLERLDMTFSALTTSAVFSARGFDIDFDDEVAVILNGTIIGYLRKSANGAEQYSEFTITPSQMLSSNQLSLVVRQLGYRWGVRNLLLRAR